MQSERIKETNQQLEELVQEHTYLLSKQTEQLREYAFINAHLFHAPWARIQGLMQILEETSKSPNNEPIFRKLHENLFEFENIIERITSLLEKGEHFSRSDFGVLSEDYRYPDEPEAEDQEDEDDYPPMKIV